MIPGFLIIMMSMVMRQYRRDNETGKWEKSLHRDACKSHRQNTRHFRWRCHYVNTIIASLYHSMTGLHVTLTPIGETSMADTNLLGDDNLFGDITNEQQALAAVKQSGLALKYVPGPLRDEVRRALKSGA